MPQIQINGELREVSQAEYDALTQNGQASTPVDGSYEQYAAARAKEQAVTKLADGDAALGETTNVSPEFRQELTNIRTSADTAAGDNKDAYATRYDQEQQDLYTNAPLSREALREELTAPPPTTAPGTVGVDVPQQQGTDGQVIGTLNTSIPGVGEPSGSIVSSPVKGLSAGGLTTGSPAAGIESAPSYPTEDPQIPPPSTEGAGTFQQPPPPPDAAFRAEQAQQENRWIQAAATNPENINNNGSVTVDLGDGRREIINRDGSYEISGGDGTFRFDAAGEQTSYTTPAINGISVTTTTDGVTVTNVQQGPLTTRTISKDGELISTDTSYTAGAATFTETQIAGGDVVRTASTVVPSDDPESAGTLVTAVQVGEGDVVTNSTSLQTKSQFAAAQNEANAENIKLREELVAAKEKTLAGEPLTDSETQALEQQAEITAGANAELAQAELALADEDPTLIPPGEDPQVDTYSEADDPFPSLDTTEYEPKPVSPAEDPEIVGVVDDPVPVADIEDTPFDVSAVEDPEVPAEAEEIPVADIEDTPVEVSAAEDPEVPVEAEEISAADVSEEPAEISAFEDPEVPADEELFVDDTATDTDADDGLVVDDPQAPGDIEEFSTDLVEVEPAPLDDEEVAEYIEEFEEQQAEEVDEFVAEYEEYLEEQEEFSDSLVEQEADAQDDVQEYIEEFEEQQAEEIDEFVDEYEEYLEEEQEAFDDAYDQYLDDEDAFVDEYEEYLDDQEDLADDLIEEQEEFVDEYEEYLEEEQEEFDEAYDEFLDEEDTVNDEVEEYLDEDEDEEFGTFGEEDDDLEVDDADEYGSTYGEEDDLFDPDAADIRTDPDSVSDTGGVPTQTLADLQTDPGLLPDQVEAQAAAQRAAVTQAAKQRAQAQAVLAAQRKQANDGDWRVKLRLAPSADYLYRAAQPGILQPLSVTDGVVFPYTPQITTAYKASYNAYDLTHSNYRGYFYQGSQVEDIQINAVFTAQDSKEAEYLLAVIHFFRSATKMFYGQDAQRGAPPPLVFLQGFGEYQFNLNPCVITQFNYVLPSDVDYIRAGSPNINGTNLLQKRDRQDLPTNPFSAAWTRLKNAGAKKGAIPTPPAPPTLGTNRPTYVPTKIDINVILHPIQSREQVSKQFSVKQYANGDLLKGGFW